jgi:putative component of toxin-antitoxin plasmid stabilization module
VGGGGWQLKVYEDEDGHQPFTAWAKKLSETKFVSVDAALRLVLAARGLDLARTEWLKPLGEGLHEFRIRHDNDEIRHMFAGQAARIRKRERILLRVFVHFYGSRIILLLGGYDKGKDPTERRQQREIAQARKHLAEWRRRRRGSNRPG